MFHLLYGSDDYGVEEGVSALLDRLCGGRDHHSVMTLDQATVSSTSLREACVTQSLFSDRQVVLTRGLLGAWSARTEGAKASSRPTAAEFARFAEALPVTTDLILRENELTPANRYLKELSSLEAEVAEIRLFAAPKETGEREAWAARHIRAMVAARGGQVEGQAAALLAQRTTGDLRLASQEIDKLLAYTAPSGQISAAEVMLLVSDMEETRVFDLADAVAAARPTAVVDLTEKLLAEGQAPEQIMAVIGARIRDLCWLSASREEGMPESRFLAQAGWTPWRLRQASSALARYRPEALGAAQRMLVAADLALKSRPTGDRHEVVLLTLLAIAQRTGSTDLEAALAYPY
jgi:DNA polymerase III delta subunit